MHKPFPAGALALALTLPAAAWAAGDPSSASSAADVEALRREIGAMRADYEARLKALEARVRTAEAAAATATAAPSAGAPGWGSAPAAAAATGASTAPAAAAAPAIAAAPPTATAGASGGANSFNPAVSLILSGGYTRTQRDPAGYAITGFPHSPDNEIGPGERGFTLGETELTFSASVDPWFRGAATLALEPDNSVSLEEAFVESTSLGYGLTAKAGRFFSNVGYLNTQHAHVWDFVDSPMAYQALLGSQYANDGAQLRWLAPTDTFLELSAEAGRGSAYPGTDTNGNGAGMFALGAHTGGDVGTSHSWRAGVSMLQAKAADQTLAGMDTMGSPFDSTFTGRTRVWIADGVWKWAPEGNASRTSFKLQGEYLYSQRSGNLVVDPAAAAVAGDYDSTQSGWYLQGVYQFASRWRVGLRTERLDAGTPAFSAGNELVANNGYAPTKNSLLLEYAPSEFSRIRVQLARDEARQGQPDNQIWLQYQMSLGAHGAHSY